MNRQKWESGRPKGVKFDSSKLEYLGDYEMDPVLSAKVEKMIEIADRQLEEVRINFRWGQSQLAVVKRAAEIMGVAYQTYMKQVLYRQACADVRSFTEVSEPKPQSRQSARTDSSTRSSKSVSGSVKETTGKYTVQKKAKRKAKTK